MMMMMNNNDSDSESHENNDNGIMISYRWIPLTKGQALMSLLLSLKQVVFPVIWDAISLT